MKRALPHADRAIRRPVDRVPVEIEGEVSVPTDAEQRRLGVFPHHQGSGLRLACQWRVMGDLQVTKHGGVWGQRSDVR